MESSSGGNNSEPLRLKKSKKKRGIYEKIGQYMATQKSNYEGVRIYENSRSLKNIYMETSSEDERKVATSGRNRTRSERGQSLDYGQLEKKGLSWFNRESRSTEHTLARPLKEQKRKHHTLDRTEKYVMEHLRNKLRNPATLSYNAHSSSQEWDPRESRHQSDIYSSLGDERNRYLSSGRSADDLLSSVRDGSKSKKSGRLQIGKRFLRGEIGIKSFNYYLIKEGLKTTPSTTTSVRANPEHAGSKAPEIRDDKKSSEQQQRRYKDFSSSAANEGWLTKNKGWGEENIYEEIFFRDRHSLKGDPKASGRHHGHSHASAPIGGSVGRAAGRSWGGGDKRERSSVLFQDDCEICTQQEQCANENCGICDANCVRNPTYAKRSKSSNPRARPALNFNTDEDVGGGSEESEAVYARIHRGKGGVFVNKYAEMGSHYSRIVPKRDVVSLVAAADDDDDEDTGGTVNKAQPQQPVLQFQSYNPNNPGVYKIETTPIAVTSNYNPFEAATDSAPQLPNKQNIYQEIRHANVAGGKSSSSSDSLTHSRNLSRRVGDAFRQDVLEDIYSKPRPGAATRRKDTVIYKAPSTSMLSEEVAAGRHYKGEMSDSSIGDSLFSYGNQRRYFGSSESCRLGSDCQRCPERCNYYSEDNTNYCRHCDCSSSYFSSDFDEMPNAGAGPGAFNRNVSTRVSLQSNPPATGVASKQQQHRDNYYDYPRKLKSTNNNNNTNPKCEPGYGEEFMRHVIHVKNTTSMCDEDSYYSKPKSNLPRNNTTGMGTSEDKPPATTKALATEAVASRIEIRNRDSTVATAPRKDAKRNTRKKYYYDDIMTIPLSEVAYNLSYGMIQRENKARDAPERDTSGVPATSTDTTTPAFRIYEEIKERRVESPPPKQKEPTYAVVMAKPRVEEVVKGTGGAKPKVMTTAPDYDDEIPTMQMMMKKSQPIYASPVKVKRITEKKPVAEQKSSLSVDTMGMTSTGGSKWTEQCEKSDFDTSLKDVPGPSSGLENVEQTYRKSGQEQSSAEWKAQKFQLGNNPGDEEIEPVRIDGTGDKRQFEELSSSVHNQKLPVSVIMQK